MLFLFATTTLFIVVRGFGNGLPASESDYGITTLKTGNESDANLYFVDDLALSHKMHVIISVANCACVGFAEAEKLAQIDYLSIMKYLFSFGVYVNDNIPERVKCGLTQSQIQARTSLKINRVGTLIPSTSVKYSIWQPIPVHPPEEEAVQGTILYAGMRDFRDHSHVKHNSDEIYSTDKSGGFLFLQGTVYMRPCRLWPWYLPWILDAYPGDEYELRMVPPFSTTPYMNSTEAELFYEIVASMTEREIITDRHRANLKDNNDNKSGRVRVFMFQALFIEHRFAGEFLTLLAEFKDTPLSPYVYIPYIFQMMWDKNSWIHMQEDRNDTIYAVRDPLTSSCLGGDVSSTLAALNLPITQGVWDFAYGWCGWLSTPAEKIDYILKTTTRYIHNHIYETGFFLGLSFFLIVCMCCMCVYRKRIAACFKPCCVQLDGWYKIARVHLCGPDIKYGRLPVHTAYTPHDTKTKDPENSTL